MSQDPPDPEEINRLRAEVERLRNELFLARKESALARRQNRVEFCRQLVGALGHELRTSLTLVLGWTELLIDGKLSPEKRSVAYDSIYTAGWRIEAALRWLERIAERESQPRESWLLADLTAQASDLQPARGSRSAPRRPDEQ